MIKEKFISVAIIAKNEEKHISETINSVLVQDFPKNLYELIIIDGNSKDRTLEIAKQFQKKDRRIRIFQEKGKSSHGNARNLAVKKAKGEYIAFIDADCIAEKNWLSSLVISFQEESHKNPEVAGVGGISIPAKADNWKEVLIASMLSSFLGSGIVKSKKYAKSIPNYNAVYNKKILMREKYSALKVGEDFELNQRLLKKGYRLISDPDIKVYHHQEPSFSSFAKQMFIYGKAQAQVYKRIKAIRPFAVFAPIYFILLAILLVLGLFSKAAGFLFQILFAPYLLAILLSTLILALRIKKIYALFGVIAYPLQHISYSLGVLFGALNEK